MEPITTAIAVTAYLGQKALAIIEDKFGVSVIQRWTRYRAEQFFMAFVAAVEKEINKNEAGKSEADRFLDEILSDSRKSEVLFDAYRKVALSKSKDLGPRIIGLLTAHIVLENRDATLVEDKVLTAAESLSNSELIEFRNVFRKYQSECKVDKSGYLTLSNGYDHYTVGEDFRINPGPGDLESGWGSWATKLCNLGMLHQDTVQRQWQYYEDGERGIDEDGIAGKIEYLLVFSPACPLLANYVDRISRPET